MADLSKLVPSEIVHSVMYLGKPIGVKVTLISPDSEQVKRVTRAVKDDNTRRRAAGKTVTAIREEEQNLEVLIACMTGWTWEGDNDFDGKKPEFNETNIRMVLGRLEWFKDDLVATVNEASNFLPN